MKRSSNRILTTHVGSLPRPEELRAMLVARDDGQDYSPSDFDAAVRDAVHEAVQLQVAHSIDIVNDGEQSKRSWSTYARERLGGHAPRPRPEGGPRHSIFSRDNEQFPEYFELFGPGRGPNTRGGISASGSVPRSDTCVEPLTYIGQEFLQRDIDNLKRAVSGQPVEEAFLTAVSPGTIEHWLHNEYYRNEEEYLFAIADAMRVEYEAIVDAGFMLQIDDPDLADAWQMHPEMEVGDYRKYAELRIEALNHGLRNISPDSVRLHVCWGSYHGPHRFDIEMSDIVDIVLKTRANGFAVEAANPRHAHDWRAWQEVSISDDKVIIPGVVGHDSDFIEHPELIADRIEKYAAIFGRENVVASTDCGLGPRVGHPSIAWAKFDALAEGARIANTRLWR